MEIRLDPSCLVECVDCLLRRVIKWPGKTLVTRVEVPGITLLVRAALRTEPTPGTARMVGAAKQKIVPNHIQRAIRRNAYVKRVENACIASMRIC